MSDRSRKQTPLMQKRLKTAEEVHMHADGSNEASSRYAHAIRINFLIVSCFFGLLLGILFPVIVCLLGVHMNYLFYHFFRARVLWGTIAVGIIGVVFLFVRLLRLAGPCLVLFALGANISADLVEAQIARYYQETTQGIMGYAVSGKRSVDDWLAEIDRCLRYLDRRSYIDFSPHFGGQKVEFFWESGERVEKVLRRLAVASGGRITIEAKPNPWSFGPVPGAVYHVTEYVP